MYTAPALGRGLDRGQLKMTQADTAYAVRMSLDSTARAGAGSSCNDDLAPKRADL